MTMKLISILIFAAALASAQNQPASRPVIVTDTATGTDTYTGCPTPAITSYVTGMEIRFLPATDNTGAATINLCALGALAIKRLTGLDPDDGDIKANKYVRLIYDGTNMQIVSSVANNQTQYKEWTLDGDGSVLVAKTGNEKHIDRACKVLDI